MSDRQRDTTDACRFDQWVAEHGRAVRGYLRAMVRRPEVAEELVQEVFLRAWRARQAYQEQGAARAYLLRIADRLACDRARRAGTEVQLDVDGWQQCEPACREGEPSQAVALAEDRALLAAALEELAPLQRRVLLLRYYGQLGFAEIAETIGCPLSTALSHCHRGLERLRQRLLERLP